MRRRIKRAERVRPEDYAAIAAPGRLRKLRKRNARPDTAAADALTRWEQARPPVWNGPAFDKWINTPPPRWFDAAALRRWEQRRAELLAQWERNRPAVVREWEQDIKTR